MWPCILYNNRKSNILRNIQANTSQKYKKQQNLFDKIQEVFSVQRKPITVTCDFSLK